MSIFAPRTELVESHQSCLRMVRRVRERPEERQLRNGGRGSLITVGATRGKNLFEGALLTAKYFFDALDMSYEGGIFFRSLEKRNAVKENP